MAFQGVGGLHSVGDSPPVVSKATSPQRWTSIFGFVECFALDNIHFKFTLLLLVYCTIEYQVIHIQDPYSSLLIKTSFVDITKLTTKKERKVREITQKENSLMNRRSI